MAAVKLDVLKTNHLFPCMKFVWLMVMTLLVRDGSADQPWRTISPDVVYGHKDGLALTYDVVTPTDDGKGKAVLFMVSGGWVSRWQPPEAVVRSRLPEKRNLFEKLVKQGYTLILVRHGSSPRYKVPDAVKDVRLAVKHVKFNAEKLGIDPDSIGVCGGSAGGHLSLMLGTTGTDGIKQPSSVLTAGSRVKAVVAYFPPTFLKKYMEDPNFVRNFPALDFGIEKADQVSPLFKVTADDAPTLLIHGDQDKLVPLVHSEKIHKAFEKTGVQHKLIVIKGAAHGFGGADGQRAETALLRWFDENL